VISVRFELIAGHRERCAWRNFEDRKPINPLSRGERARGGGQVLDFNALRQALRALRLITYYCFTRWIPARRPDWRQGYEQDYEHLMNLN